MGVSNMFDWLTWETGNILGISKTQYWKKIAKWTHNEELQDSPLDEKLKQVKERLEKEVAANDQPNRYSPPKSAILSPREALRRAKFFSEDYLNKEFDIFWSLSSDAYLDAFYSRLLELKTGGNWSSHGNSSRFRYSTDISEMQMDNLSYNASEGLLIANELKLGSKKNPDQILKYALMHQRLMEGGYVPQDTRFFLLFIEPEAKNFNWPDEIEREIEYCRRTQKTTSSSVLEPDVLTTAKNATIASTSWYDLVEFNEHYLTSLSLPTQQVEQKLISGFNQSLRSKACLQKI